MFNDKIKEAIQSISAISFNARVIADRLGVSTSSSGTVETALAAAKTDDVKELKAEIERLTNEVQRLHHLVDDEPEEAVFSDEEAYNFSQSLDKTLTAMPQILITTSYNRAYLKPYPRNIRYLICLALVNNFTARDLKPLPLWYGVVANNGSLS